LYRKIDDFLVDWSKSADGTLAVLKSLKDDKLNVAIVEGHNTLGWLGWHLATSPEFFAGQIGLNVKKSKTINDLPTKATVIVEAYKKIAEDIKTEVEQTLTDEKLAEDMESFGQVTTRGAMLRTLIDHQTHHRGQMTVLLRQAGLPVPGVMGPTKEEQVK